jgi:carotenoid cleavage dioxygenase
MRRRPPPGHLPRRDFLQRAALLAAGFSLPRVLGGCSGDPGEPAAQPGSDSGAPPLPFDPTKKWWLQGNFAPVLDERYDTDLVVRGALPPELSGLYVRNGSNPQSGESPHWFFGDGMVHGVRFEKGAARWYRNRWVRTALFESGTGFGSSGGAPPTGEQNQSNVSVVWQGGRLLSSGEVGFPHELDPADLSTRGVIDFDGKLKTSFTAHPKIDPQTGRMHAFGYWFLPPYLVYYVVEPDGRVSSLEEIAVGKPTMVHSFAMTEKDIVFWELPVVFDLAAALAGEVNPFRWQPDYGARIGVLPIGAAASEIRWVEIEPCYVFHEVNARREGDDVVVDVVRHPDMFAGDELGDEPSRIVRWRVGTGGEQLGFSDEVVADRSWELPTHDRRFTGRKTRHGWFVTTREHPETLDLAGTGHVDFETGETHVWDPGPTRHADEALFVPGGDGEGEGWLLTFVYDHASDSSTLAVLDATDVTAGPVAEVELPRRVPHGFHATWIPD